MSKLTRKPTRWRPFIGTVSCLLMAACLARAESEAGVSAQPVSISRSVVIHVGSLEDAAASIVESASLKAEKLSAATASDFGSPSAAPPEIPYVRTHFSGLVDNYEALPPDTHGAVGPEHLVMMLNTEFAVQDRSGKILKRTKIGEFWRPVGVTNVFDPRVVYDAATRRYYATAAANGRQTNAMILLGSSQTPDPTGEWRLVAIEADKTGELWADYPNIGFNRTWLAMTYNMLTVGPTNRFVRSDVYIVDKAMLAAGANPSVRRFSETNAFSLVPAVTYGTSEPNLYVLSEFPNNTRLRVGRIQGALGSETFVNIHALTPAVPAWGFWNVNEQSPNGSNSAPQRGSATNIFANDSRIHSAQYRNGMLWAAHHVFQELGSVRERTAIQWWNLGLDGRILQRGLIEDPTAAVHYAFPSLAVNRSNDVLIGFTRFSKADYASAALSYRRAADAPGTVSVPAVFKAGLAPYVRMTSRGRNSWGDYSATAVDPLNDIDLWTFQEYAETKGARGDRWGTHWAYVAFSTNDPAVVVAQSGSQFVPRVGQTLELSATAAGTPPIRFQWRQNGANLAGATNATLSLPSLGTRQLGTYVLMASNAFGYDFSVDIVLSFAAPVFKETPLGGSVNRGSNVVLNALAEGTAPISYQWFQNGAAIARATNASLPLPAFAESRQGDYLVEARNAAGTARTSPARLLLSDPTASSRPNLTSPQRQADGSLTFDLLINPILPIEIQRSSNLVDWVFHAAPTNTGTRSSIRIAPLTNVPRLFFRAVIKP